MDPVGLELGMLRGKMAGALARAKKENDPLPWVETSKAALDYLFPQGMGTAKYGIYQGVALCEHGKKDEIQAELAASPFERMHGTDAGTVEGPLA